MSTDILKSEIRLMKSQRLDDTAQGGGQMTAYEVVSGTINELFPDISRLDRVYGRVSLRKAFLSVQTIGQQTYYGSHAVLTKNASDPNVSVCFFSSEDWYDTREESRQRIESYLVRGPLYAAALWGPHFKGTRKLAIFTEAGWALPEVGDVLVLVKNMELANEEYQYVRVTDVVDITQEFTGEYNGTAYSFAKKIISVEIGNELLYDFAGEEIARAFDYSTGTTTKIFTTVAADASRYYGVATLSEDVNADELQIRVDSIFTPLVPSAQSQTAITDAGIGQALTPLLQTDSAIVSIVRSLSYSISNNARLYIGEGIVPGSFSWTGGIILSDDKCGNIYSGTDIVGSITYGTGTVIFSNVTGTLSGTGIATYKPACAPTLVAETGAINIDVNNRGFVYTYTCDPLPKPGTLKVDYFAGGKWYSLKDRGDGALRGSDTAMGSGSVNFVTGSTSLTLGAQPDAGSRILLFWATNASFYNLNGEVLDVKYNGTTQYPSIARGSLSIAWNSDSYAAVDNGNGDLTVGTWDGTKWVSSSTVIGYIKYATGDYEFGIHSSQSLPSVAESFHMKYSYGDKNEETFNPIRNANGTVSFFLSNTPILPKTFEIIWHTNQIEYYDGSSPSIIGVRSVDPTHTFTDNGIGGFKNEDSSEFMTYIPSTINYTSGEIMLMPDRVGYFPLPLYRWTNQRVATTEQVEPGQIAETTRLFTLDRIQYMQAASLWPTSGIFEVGYSTVDGANSFDDSVTITKKYYIKESSQLAIIPGSLSFWAGSKYVTDISGKLFTDISGVTNIGTEVGTINYATRTVTITNDLANSRTIAIISAAGTAAIDPVQMIFFRTPGAPLTPGSFSIQGTAADGTHITATSNFAGNIVGTYAVGKIDYETGIGQVSFGHWVTDVYSALPVEDRPPWYTSDNVVDDNIWMPYSVSLQTISINCVIYSYLPLDADLLGLDPVRLPMDGKVPIFRDGNIILIHNTTRENLPNPLIAETIHLTRQNVDLIEVYDSTGKYFPEIEGLVENYTVDLEAGTVTILPTFNTTGFTAPFYAIHRIEDMCLASDVQITGHIAITNPLKNSYKAEETLVSSVLPSADLQARAYNEIVQSTWTGEWSDDLIGSAPLAQYDFVNYPINVTNKGATKERWLLKFKTTTTFDIIGERLGVLRENVSTSGWPGGIISVTNHLTGEVYWELNQAGLGVGWAAGNCIRFNTDAANFPYWFVRTTLQAPATTASDNYEFQIRGDSI